MADQDNSLFAIEVDADDYADAVAEDTPSVSRTYQSEKDFQDVKARYSAKIDGGNSYEDLIAAVPVLDQTASGLADGRNTFNAKTKLSKKHIQLLGYAVGELYYDKEFKRAIEQCQRVRSSCEVDRKTEDSLERWIVRCEERFR